MYPSDLTARRRPQLVLYTQVALQGNLRNARARLQAAIQQRPRQLQNAMLRCSVAEWDGRALQECGAKAAEPCETFAAATTQSHAKLERLTSPSSVSGTLDTALRVGQKNRRRQIRAVCPWAS